jgi:2-polyprenyl-3-methyl-5-hydroxy-6-metoxy-1,4-benzoquinol methylase
VQIRADRGKATVVVDGMKSASAHRAYRRRKYQTVAHEAPSNFVADLQRLRNWPSMKGSLWRRAFIVKLTYAVNSRLLTSSINGRNLKILDVGCGTGCISLELSRLGHDVLGLDQNERMIKIATRTKKARNSRRGKLQYENADFGKWSGTTGAYDVVLFSRVLHDLPNPQNVLSKAHRLLKSHGRIVCLEYAYNTIDKKTAAWLYQIRKPLELQGWYSPPHLPDDPSKAVDHIMQEAVTGRKEHINKFEEMMRPLKRLFRQESLSWHPYHFWTVLSDMRVPNPRTEERLASMVKKQEEFLLGSGEIQPALFLYSGTKK